MYPYSYQITLRIFHPSIEPTEITTALGLQPKRAWKAGQPRQTPKGTPLDGIYSESYWFTNLTDGEQISEGTLLEDYVDHFCCQLSQHSQFFNQIRKEGGKIELHASSYSKRNYGFEFSPTLTQKLSDLGLTLWIDIYPYEQNW